MSRQFIQQLESDAKSPNGETIDALAAALGVENSFFRVPIRNSVKVEQTHFRKLRSTPVSLVHQILAHGTMLEALISYLESRLNLPPVRFPEIQADRDDQIDEAAADSRKFWGLSSNKPIQNMTRVLENAGAVVVQLGGISEKIDALSMNRGRPIIVRSTSKESLCRMRYDLAHECGHLVMHLGIETGDKETENQANRFAGAFLLPEEPFRQEFPSSYRMDWRAVFSMKLKWKVSVQAIVKRAHDLGLIDAAQYKRAFAQLQRNGQMKKEKFDDKMPLEKPEMLSKCFDVLHENKRLYFAGIAKDIDVKPELLSKLTSFLEIPGTRDDANVQSQESYHNVIQFSRATNTN